MEYVGRLYTSGIWTTRSGKAAEFVEAWRAFAEWTSAHQAGAGEAYLLQDVDYENRFLSFSPWPSAEVIAQWRATPQFAEFVAQARALCEDMQPRTLRVAAHVS